VAEVIPWQADGAQLGPSAAQNHGDTGHPGQEHDLVAEVIPCKADGAQLGPSAAQNHRDNGHPALEHGLVAEVLPSGVESHGNAGTYKQSCGAKVVLQSVAGYDGGLDAEVTDEQAGGIQVAMVASPAAAGHKNRLSAHS
jgi:hypothetical protein